MKISLALHDDFSAGMQRAADAAHVLRHDLAMLEATWEPHDWSDFS